MGYFFTKSYRHKSYSFLWKLLGLIGTMKKTSDYIKISYYNLKGQDKKVLCGEFKTI